MPLVPSLQLALVDVVDVAKWEERINLYWMLFCRAHIMAMHLPKTDGQRILLTWQPSFWFREIARVLAKEFRHQGKLSIKNSMKKIKIFRLLGASLPSTILRGLVVFLPGY